MYLNNINNKWKLSMEMSIKSEKKRESQKESTHKWFTEYLPHNIDNSPGSTRVIHIILQLL